MLKRVMYVLLIFGLGGLISRAASLQETSPMPSLVQVIEYYDARLDHYFLSVDPAEINALDTGRIPGFTRTGEQFMAYSAAPATAGLSPVCRFYGLPAAGLDSHFYTGFPDECAAVAARFASVWLLESSNAFQIQMPDLVTGACPEETGPVYRLFNNRADASHRYTTVADIKQAMVSQGYISEGYGPNGVAFCSANLSTFETRKSAAGVVRWFDFDTPAQLGGGYGGNFGVFSGSSIPHLSPVIDTSVKASGTGSLRFDIPAFSGSDGFGAWFTNFSADLATQFGENTEFFVQWRQRFNQAFIDTIFHEDAAHGGGVQGGIKQAIITTGDQSNRIYNSCEALETVVQTYYQHRFPIVYNSCTGSGTHGPYSGMYEPIAGSDFLLENTRPTPFCKYSQAGTQTSQGLPAAVPSGCFAWVADEWLTFQMGVTLGPRNNVTNDFDDSRTRLWGAREGQPSQLLIDWKPGVGGYFPLAAGPLSENQKFGKIWLLPYMTNKDFTQVHDLAQTWYDELIISTQRIADTGVSGSVAPPPPPPPPPNLSVLSNNTAIDLGSYTCTDVVGESRGSCKTITDYSAIVYDANRLRMVAFGGGHAATSYDAINTFKMDTLKWIEDYQPLECAAKTMANFDATNGAWRTGNASGPYPRPLARHTEQEIVVVGDELILLAGVEGNGDYCSNLPNYTGHEFNTPARVTHYNFVTKTWLFTNVPGTAQWPGAAYDPVSNKIIMLGQVGLEIYDPVAKTKTLAIDFTRVANAIKDEQGNNLSNTLSYNNNLIYFPSSQKMYYFERYSQRVFEINLNRSNFSQTTITRLDTTGTPPPPGEMGFAYDSTNQIIGGGPRANTFYAYNPLTKTWSSNLVQGGAPGSLAFHAIDYDPVKNVFIFVTDAASGRKTWAYRYAR
jgi:hypothetical protein